MRWFGEDLKRPIKRVQLFTKERGDLAYERQGVLRKACTCHPSPLPCLSCCGFGQPSSNVSHWRVPWRPLPHNLVLVFLIYNILCLTDWSMGLLWPKRLSGPCYTSANMILLKERIGRHWPFSHSAVPVNPPCITHSVTQILHYE